VVSFTPRPLYPQGKGPWYPLDRRLGGPQHRILLSLANIIPTSEVRASVMLLLLVVGNQTLWGWGCLQLRIVNTKFRESRSPDSEVDIIYTSTA